ncbi:class I SAM-dependent methyltransferase [Pseudooceanicola sp. HF7]|uniref:class I SAM-dependent methyltransferase n=1 Tax=Pseudooceanicola sp. HF7 TaxID=2721560 RepID=UPI00142FBD2E|nr:class I SAM-dependent methyltransferase [Pseudooceanicola sp. HF7]NIZ10934.1 class I SAM-dependent methyltransferase [Pseudooceanicola sp. HF7]
MTSPKGGAGKDLDEGAVAGHYGGSRLRETVFDALAKAGLDMAALTPRMLAPVDEFHMGGRGATKEIVVRAGIAGERVLDIGSGLGGLARHLAAEAGCRVTGLDLTPEFVSLAQELTDLTGLAEQVDFKLGSALDLPFGAEVFDAVTSFHVAMNIADRAGMYREAARVLKPGGTLVIYDVLKGPQEGLLFPVPWAETAETSHLVSAEEMQILLSDQGFVISEQEDRTPSILASHTASLANLSSGTPALGLHLLQGENAAEKSRNMIAMAKAGQVTLGLFIARKPA